MTEFASQPEPASSSQPGEPMLPDEIAPERSPERSPIPAGVGLASIGSLALAACGGGGGSSPTLAPTAPPVIITQGITPTQASRFLSQAAIGYSKADVLNLSDSGVNRWLDTQFTVLRTQKFWDFLVTNGYDAAANMNTVNGFDRWCGRS